MKVNQTKYISWNSMAISLNIAEKLSILYYTTIIFWFQKCPVYLSRIKKDCIPYSSKNADIDKDGGS